MVKGNDQKRRMLWWKVDTLKSDWGKAEIAIRLAVRRRTADVVVVDVTPCVEIFIKTVGVDEPNA